MIDLKNLDRWAVIERGKMFALPGTRARTVTIEVRAENVSPVYLTDGKGNLEFLAICDGYEKIKVGVPDGQFAVCTLPEHTLYIYTMEMQKASVVIPDAHVFTRIVERKARNPLVEEMAAQMNYNMERRIAALAAEMERRSEARVADAVAKATKKPERKTDANLDEKSAEELTKPVAVSVGEAPRPDSAAAAKPGGSDDGQSGGNDGTKP